MNLTLKMSHYSLLFCVTSFVAASENSNSYYKKFRLPDHAVVLAILNKHNVDSPERVISDQVALEISNKKLSTSDVYQKLHIVGGFGNQEICISSYQEAAQEIIKNSYEDRKICVIC